MRENRFIAEVTAFLVGTGLGRSYDGLIYIVMSLGCPSLSFSVDLTRFAASGNLRY